MLPNSSTGIGGTTKCTNVASHTQEDTTKNIFRVQECVYRCSELFKMFLNGYKVIVTKSIYDPMSDFYNTS